jgi:predicted nucleic acid-binding Zn ribbon protein
MTDRVAELAYRRQRRYVFVITLVVVIALVVLCVLLA